MELLSPGGDMEKMTAALDFGADAVYVGAKSLGMRASAGNFTFEDLGIAVKLAHSKNVKVYLTCNTLPTNAQIDELEPFFDSALEAGVDALIVADIGILMAAKRRMPQMEVHISTQAGVVNYLTATELYNLGASRAVLARELSIGDIAEIRAKTPPAMQLEVFVHGAMCVSFSGRCLLSQYVIGRDANRGECAQPCRWGYYLVEEKRPNEFYKIYEDEKGTYILNAKDLCMIGHIDTLAKAGVSSLKIEGRAKSAYYAAVITNAYRIALDEYNRSPKDYKTPQWLFDEVKKVSHRQYCEGFFFGRPDNSQFYESGGYVRECDIVAVVEASSDGLLSCVQRNKFLRGDKLELLSPGQKPVEITAEELFDIGMNPIESCPHATMRFRLKYGGEAPKGSILRKQRPESA